MFEEFLTSTYEITPYTLAVLTQKDTNGNISACILEDEVEYVVNHSPSKVIDIACKFFGSSLRGRQDGTREICGITHKAPISIDPLSGMYFFPTNSPTNLNCSWIAHSHIKEVVRSSNQATEVIFKNGRKITLSNSFGSILNQVQRTAQYRYLLDNRIKHLQRQSGEQSTEPLT